ncbi:MAG: hypothetical protein QGF87_04305, partial [Woeseiaceae bacterium]|nr:hypothetical protein [Woeseiaceae bacterium]
AAFNFSKRLPEEFAKASMKLSDRAVRIISVIGILILIGQGSLSFSDIDTTGWALVAAYILFVLIYIQVRARHLDRQAPP